MATTVLWGEYNLKCDSHEGHDNDESNCDAKMINIRWVVTSLPATKGGQLSSGIEVNIVFVSSSIVIIKYHYHQSSWHHHHHPPCQLDLLQPSWGCFLILAVNCNCNGQSPVIVFIISFYNHHNHLIVIIIIIIFFIRIICRHFGCQSSLWSGLLWS